MGSKAEGGHHMSDYEPADGIWIDDPQQVEPVCYCAECGGEIYPGERAYKGLTSGMWVHYDCMIEEVADDD